MKRIRLIGLTLIAVLALGALAASSASAEGPEISPAGTKEAPIKFEGINNGNTVLESTLGTKVTCKVAKAKGEFSSANLGLVLIDFEGCESGGAKCNSPKDNAGVILVLLNMHLVDVLPTGTLDLGVWLEPKEELPGTGDLHFTCGAILTSVILGSVIGVADNLAGELLTNGAKGKEFKVLWKGAKGEQEIKTCDLEKAFCEGKKFELLSDFGFGHELGAEIADATLKFEKEVEFKF